MSMSAPEQEEGFLSHLVELRTRLVRAALSVLVVFLALWPFMRHIFDLLSRPMISALPQGAKLLATGVITPFLVPLKVTLFAAFLLALPFVLYQAWAFIAPGLYQHEKRLALPVLVSSVAMFFAGIAYCYFVVFGVVFRFIAGFAPENVNVAPDIEQYFDFVIRMFIAFGLAFEVPIAVMLLVRLGITSVAKLRHVRPYVIVGAFVVAAIVTPPDVLSQMLLALPLWLLYELGVLLATIVGGKNRQQQAPAE
ncbi:MAG TPA: twin-arginine translocase subunit TatC [Burkholderiaceae bacterium]|nr:twin-arginine translocase subunit TatC [Burkholderiaceae bacterium]